MRSLILKNNGSIVTLFEPFAREEKLQRLVSSLGFDDFHYNEAVGGKIWILWRAPYEFKVVSVSTYMITGWFMLEGTQTLVSFVYAKCTQVDRRRLWKSLVDCRSIAHPWAVLGDFNIIREDRECVCGCPRAAQSMDDCNECLDACGLVELNYLGNLLSGVMGRRGLFESR